MSTLIDSLEASDQLRLERRFYPRIVPRSPIQLNLSDQTPGIILNLSENGLLATTPVALNLNSVHPVVLSLDGTAAPIRTCVLTVWSEPDWQKAGLQFLDLSDADRQTFRLWATREAKKIATQVPPPPALAQGPARPQAASIAPRTSGVPPLNASTNFSAEPRPQPAPIRYFLVSFTATLFLGLAWAAVEYALPGKPAKSPVTAVSPRTPRRTPDTASTARVPAPAATPPTALTAERVATFAPAPHTVVPKASPSRLFEPRPKTDSKPAPTKPPETSGLAKQPSPQTAATGPIAPPKSVDEPASSQVQPGTTPATQLSASTATPSGTTATALNPAPSSSPVTNTPSNPSSTAPGSYPPPLNPRPIAPNLAPQPAPHRATIASAAPVRVAPTPAYSTQTLELPSTGTSAYMQWPGERVVRSPNMTLHIQRWVWVKSNHWLWHGRKKVDLGELTARVDPQMPRSAPAFGSITVLAAIGKNGQISNVRPLYGPAQLLPSVSAALHGWRYQPTYVDGKPTETLARIEVDFHSQ